MGDMSLGCLTTTSNSTMSNLNMMHVAGMGNFNQYHQQEVYEVYPAGHMQSLMSKIDQLQHSNKQLQDLVRSQEQSLSQWRSGYIRCDSAQKKRIRVNTDNLVLL